MTDFFQHQEAARKRTWRLIVMFSGAVVLVVGMVCGAIALYTEFEGRMQKDAVVTGGLVTAGVIAIGTSWKLLQLSRGGSVVAASLGGRPVDPDTQQPDERQLLNVVEEMSLASGVPVPQVWLLEDEDGINAFAAGYSPSDTVLGVTRGAMRNLTRGELQGVIAHEFSHILHGDMRLNLRLIGIVHGILVLYLIGRGIVRGTSRRSGRSSKGQGQAILIGVALIAIGWLGWLMARIIKSAISRQREFLADASAVQFTRHPEGIGHALIKIGGYQYGSRLETARAEEASHMMFSNALKQFMGGGALATHPPLPDRIRAILPHWDGDLPKTALPDIDTARRVERVPEGVSAFTGEVHRSMQSVTPQEVIQRVGILTPADIETGMIVRAAIPDELHALLRDPAGAQAIVFALMLSESTTMRAAEEDVLRQSVDPQTFGTAVSVADKVREWPSSRTLVLIDLAIPALRKLTPAEYDRFTSVLDALIYSDQQVDLFEFMVQRVVRRHLDRWFRLTKPPSVRFRSFKQLEPELAVILTTLAHAGRRTLDEANSALEAGRKLLAEHGVYLKVPPTPAGLDQLGAALEKFDRATPLVKKQLLLACVRVAAADDTLSNEEAELLRAISDTIGCPMPIWRGQ